MLFVFVCADCAMGYNPISVGERVSDIGDDSVPNNVSVSISSKDISLYLPIAPPSKPLWLHFWHCLVGNCTKLDRLFRCLPCKSLSYMHDINTAFN